MLKIITYPEIKPRRFAHLETRIVDAIGWPILRLALASHYPVLQNWAFEQIKLYRPAKAEQLLLVLAGHRNINIMRLAIATLASMNHPETMNLLSRRLSSLNLRVREAAIELCVTIEHPDKSRILIEILSGGYRDDVTIMASDQLSKETMPLDTIARLLRSEREADILGGLSVIRKLKSPELLPLIAELFSSEIPQIRLKAVESYAKCSELSRAESTKLYKILKLDEFDPGKVTERVKELVAEPLLGLCRQYHFKSAADAIVACGRLNIPVSDGLAYLILAQFDGIEKLTIMEALPEAFTEFVRDELFSNLSKDNHQLRYRSALLLGKKGLIPVEDSIMLAQGLIFQRCIPTRMQPATQKLLFTKLQNLLDSSKPRIRQLSIKTLGMLKHRESVSQIQLGLIDPSSVVQLEAVNALLQLEDINEEEAYVLTSLINNDPFDPGMVTPRVTLLAMIMLRARVEKEEDTSEVSQTFQVFSCISLGDVYSVLSAKGFLEQFKIFQDHKIYPEKDILLFLLFALRQEGYVSLSTDEPIRFRKAADAIAFYYDWYSKRNTLQELANPTEVEVRLSAQEAYEIAELTYYYRVPKERISSRAMTLSLHKLFLDIDDNPGQVKAVLEKLTTAPLYVRVYPDNGLKIFEKLNHHDVFTPEDRLKYLLFLLRTNSVETATEYLPFRSPKEAIHYYYDFRYKHTEKIASLSVAEITALKAIIQTLLHQHEKGMTNQLLDIFALVEPEAKVKPENISLVREQDLIIRYLNHPKTQQFSSLIYRHYRQFFTLNQSANTRDFEAGDQFLDTVDIIIQEIRKGGSYEDALLAMQNLGVQNSSSYNTIFEVLLRQGGLYAGETTVGDALSDTAEFELMFNMLIQMMPIHSSFMSTDLAKDFFRKALEREKELTAALSRIAPQWQEAGGTTGKTIIRTHQGFNYHRTNSYPNDLILALLEQASEVQLDFATVVNSRSATEFINNFRQFIASLMSEKLAEINKTYSSESTRYQALTDLLGQLQDTIPDLIRRELNLFMQATDRAKQQEVVTALSQVLGRAISKKMPISHLKPKAIFDLFSGKNMEMAEFIRTHSMPKQTRQERECSWVMLRDWIARNHAQRADILQQLDAFLAEPAAPDEEEGILVKDPLKALISQSNEIVWVPIINETTQALTCYEKKANEDSQAVVYQIGKSIWWVLYGGNADICIAMDLDLYFRDNFLLISMQSNNQFVGFNLIHIIKDRGKRKMLIAGIEPTAGYLAGNQAIDVLREFYDVCIAYAAMAGLDEVGQIGVHGTVSNRPRMVAAVQEHVLNVISPVALERPLYLASNETYLAREYHPIWKAGQRLVNF